VHGVRAGVAGPLADLVRLEDFGHRGGAGVRLGVQDVDPGRADARDDQVAAAAVVVPAARVQRWSRRSIRSVEFVAVRQFGEADHGPVPGRVGVDVQHRDRVGLVSRAGERSDVGELLRPVGSKGRGERQARGAAATVLTARVPNPTGYGRIIRDDSGAFLKITEEADATPDERAVDEINSGVYAFEAHLLGDAVKRVPTDNAKGEEYLTDVIAILRAEGHHVASVTLEDPDEVLGVNDRAQLARARQIFNARLLSTWMGAGVTVVDPATTWIDTGVSLARDVEIGPGTQLEGRTVVAAGARVGPGAQLRDTTVGEGATVIQSVCRGADIGAGAVVGPFAYLPAGSKVDAGGSAAGMNSAGINADGQLAGSERDPAHQTPGGQSPGGQSPGGPDAGGRHAGGQDAATSEGAQEA